MDLTLLMAAQLFVLKLDLLSLLLHMLHIGVKVFLRLRDLGLLNYWLDRVDVYSLRDLL